MADSRFHTLLETLVNTVADDYAEAREHARQNDSQRAGHEGESTWQRLLQHWGPNWPVVTRKYIVGPNGTSNEVDVLILKPDYPEHLRTESSILVSGVAGAFSSKLTLRRPHIKEAIEQKKRLIEIAGRLDTARGVLVGPFPFGLLAHSTEFLRNSDAFASKLQDSYEAIAYDDHDPLVTSPNHGLDALLVADKGFFSTTRVALTTGAPGNSGASIAGPVSSFDSHSLGAVTNAAPLVQFIVWLSARFADNRPSSLASLAGIFGGGSASGYMTPWPIETYPDHVQKNLNALINEYGHSKHF